MNFYKRHIGDYIKKAGHLTLLEHGIYARLMDVYYTREAGIPEDKAARLIGARTKEEVQALSNVLDEFFTLVDGVWTQGRCEEEIGIASAKADKNRENGAKGGRPKKTLTDQQPGKNPDGSDVGNHVGSEKNLSQTPDSRLQTKTLGDRASTQPELRTAEPTDPGQLSIVMRRFGISSNPGDMRLIALADQGVSADSVQAACEAAKKAKPDEAIPAAYVLAILERWAKDAADLNATGATPPRASPRQAANANMQRLNDRINGQNRHDERDEPEFIDLNERPA
jgi:uncharacterized protein YdaU (DUF1376 family)